MSNRLSETPTNKIEKTAEEIAVLEILIANRNAVFPTEVASIYRLPHCDSFDYSRFVAVKIVNAADPEDVYYYNDPQPGDLLIADKVSLTVDIATDADKIAVSSETFLIADMTGGE